MDDRLAKRHVLHDLDHRGDVIHFTGFVRIDANVGCRQNLQELFIGNPAGEIKHVAELLVLQHFPQPGQSRPPADASEMNVATPQVFEVERHVQENVQTFLDADRPDVTDQVRLTEFESGIGLNRFKGLEIGPVSNNENVARIHASPGYSKVPVAGISGHDYVAETVRLLFEPDLGPVKEVFSFILGKVEFRVRIVMIEDVFHTQEFEREGDQKDIVGGITALNDVEIRAEYKSTKCRRTPKTVRSQIRRDTRRDCSLLLASDADRRVSH